MKNEAPQLVLLLLPPKQYATSTEFMKKIYFRNYNREEAESRHSVLYNVSISKFQVTKCQCKTAFNCAEFIHGLQ
jgi:hypothetical protein